MKPKPISRGLTKAPRALARTAKPVAADTRPQDAATYSKHDFARHPRTAVVETPRHLFLSAYVNQGPCKDPPQRRSAVQPAQGRCPMDPGRDARGSDAEPNHPGCRERQGVPRTIGALHRRGQGRQRPQPRCRAPMPRHIRQR